MIIEGNSRGGPRQLGKYLAEEGANERITILEIFGTIAQDVEGAIIEMEGHAVGTRCTKPLYHVYANPEPPYWLSPDQIKETIQAIKEGLGLDGQPHVAVLHELHGRQHIHIAISRIDLDRMVAISDSNNFRKHEEIARELERRFGHPHVQGAHVHEDDQPERNRSDPKSVKAEVTAIFKSSDSAGAFREALDKAGYILANGDRRDFVIVDSAGKEHSLSRRIDGVKAVELRKFMSAIDRRTLPSVAEAKGIAEDRERGGYSARDFEKWDDAVAAKAIESDSQTEPLRKTNRARAVESDAFLNSQDKQAREWEDALWASSIKKAEKDYKEALILRAQRRKARAQAGIEKDYAAGDGYAHQSEAALADDKRRRKALSKQGVPFHPDEHVPPTPKNIFPRASKSTRRRKRVDQPEPPDVKLGQTIPDLKRREHRDDLRKRLETFLYGPRGFDRSFSQHQAREAARMSIEERERFPEHDSFKDQKLNVKVDRIDHVEESEKLYKRIERLIGRSLDPDVDAREATRRSWEKRKERTRSQNRGTKVDTFDHNEKSEQLYKRIQRLTERSIDHEVEDREPDRQRTAPGGGRSRSR